MVVCLVKIAICISGSFRNSYSTILDNVARLENAGHVVEVFLVLQPESLGLKVDWENTKLRRYKNSFSPIFYYDFSNFVDSEIRSYAYTNDWSIVETKIDFEVLLDIYGLKNIYREAQSQADDFMMRWGKYKFPFPGHFRNSLLMLHGIYAAFNCYRDSGFEAELVLRLRPDFLMSNSFIAQIGKSSDLLMPIRDSGSLWNYGWGYASDMVFVGKPEQMEILCSAINYVPIFWDPWRIVIDETKTIPFIYGDAIFSFLLHFFNIPMNSIPKGGDLVRQNRKRVTFLNSKFWDLRHELNLYLNYRKALRRWQRQ